jgi:hypothetical protein
MSDSATPDSSTPDAAASDSSTPDATAPDAPTPIELATEVAVGFAAGVPLAGLVVALGWGFLRGLFQGIGLDAGLLNALNPIGGPLGVLLVLAGACLAGYWRYRYRTVVDPDGRGHDAPWADGE